MTITPDQARELLDRATPGPWIMHRYVPEDYIRVTGEDLKDIADNGVVEDGDAHLIAAAPDLAQTIAGMRWEYAVEMMEEEWEVVGLYGPDEPWGSEADARGAMKAWRSPRPIRLVRRLVGPVEVTE